MIYNDTPPVINRVKDRSPDSVLPVFLTKGTGWAYEKEVRFINRSPGKTIPYDPKSLKRITFGCRALNDEISEIVKLVKGRDLEIQKAKLSKDSYALKFRKI